MKWMRQWGMKKKKTQIKPLNETMKKTKKIREEERNGKEVGMKKKKKKRYLG